MNWVQLGFGGGGFMVIFGGVLHTVLRLGQVLQGQKNLEARMDRIDIHQAQHEERVDRLVNGSPGQIWRGNRWQGPI